VARDGFRYFLTAGAPHGVEDPEGRMVRALLRIVEEGGPTLRAGTAAGQVFAGAVGAPSRRTFSVMGDTTNLAARLTARAPAGRVLAHAPALARSRTTFSTTAHDPLTVKGKKEPVPVAVVTDVVGRRARADVELAFVGRERELTELGELLEGTRRGAGSVAEVIGEAGLGKTRLAAEAIRRSGLPSVTLVSDPYGAMVPFLALRRLLRPLLGLADADDPAASAERLRDIARDRAPQVERWLPLVGPVVGADVPSSAVVDELDDRFRTARLRDAVRHLLDVLLPAPAVALVDDAQWVDQSSAEVLAGVFADVGSRPLAVLLTRRDTDEGLRGSDDLATTVLRPEPVSAGVARDLLLEASGGSLRPAELDAIIGQADGNPYFLIELAASGRTGELPGTIEELVGLRIDDLDGADRDVLRQAAVLGATFPASLFAQATGIPDLGELVRGSGLTAFLDAADDGTITFRRDVFRETAYAQLTFRRRRRVHHAAALAIDGSPQLAGGARLPLLSLHWSAAGVWPQAYACSREAAEEARTQFANEEAAVFCRRALDAGRRCGASREETRSLQVTLGEVLNLAGRPEEAVRAYQAARRAGTDPADAVDVVYRIGMVRRGEGRLPAALAAARQVRSLAPSLPPVEAEQWLAEADLLAAGARFWQGRSVDARRLSLEVVARAETLPPGRDRTRLLARAYALHDTAVVELDGRAGDYGERPVEMFADIGDLYNQCRFCVNVAIGHYYEGRWDRAIEMYRQSLELAERTGDVFSVAVAQMNIGELLAHQGRCAEARELLATSMASLWALHMPLAAAHAACYLGIAARIEGDLGEASARFDDSARLFAEAGRTDGFSMDELATRRLELLVDRGDLEVALAEGGSLLLRTPGPVPMHRARVHRSVGLALWAAGDRAAAAEHLADSLRSADEVSSTYESALTRLAQAELGLGDPDETLGRAVPFLESIGVRDVALVTPKAPVSSLDRDPVGGGPG
jgi:tetratricopeptide (TPR) repeat protein